MPLNLARFAACILLVLASNQPVFSQTKKIDSLKVLLTKAKEDTNKFRLYYNIAGEYWSGLPDSIDYINTFKYEDSAIGLAQKLGYQYGIFDGLMCLGNVYAFQRKLPESRKYYAKAIEAATKLSDKKLLADAYYEIAGNFFQYGNDAKNNVTNFPLSLEYYFQALKTYEEMGSKYGMANTWLKIGRTYAWQNFFTMGRGNLAEIEKCALNAMKLFRESKETTKADMMVVTFFLGRAYYFQNRFANALDLFLTALSYHKEQQDKPSITNDYLNIGRSYKALGDSSLAKSNKSLAYEMYTKALENFKLSQEINLSLRTNGFIGLGYLYIGTVQINLGQLSQARQNLDSAIVYTAKLNGEGTYQEVYQSFAKLDSAEGNYLMALKHYNMYMAYKDSNLNSRSILETQAYKLQFEFEKKEDSLKQVQLVTETNLKVEKKQKYYYLAVLTMLTLLSFLVFLNFKKQQKINRLATETFTKEKIELELQSLRSQLNPHFIFNCISSIDGLMQNNEKHNATSYLNKFARLMRNVLDGSKENSIAFSRDIETLRLYLDLEQLRNEGKYVTQLNISAELFNTDYIVPPLVIQPFVENAIQHGLKNKTGNDGLLTIDISRVEDHLQYVISDNGIGRAAASSFKTNDHRSVGTEISMERIRLFNNETHPSVTIEDKINQGKISGTVVTVKLRLK